MTDTGRHDNGSLTDPDSVNANEFRRRRQTHQATYIKEYENRVWRRNKREQKGWRRIAGNRIKETLKVRVQSHIQGCRENEGRRARKRKRERDGGTEKGEKEGGRRGDILGDGVGVGDGEGDGDSDGDGEEGTGEPEEGDGVGERVATSEKPS